jgi:hypothetical protein
MKAATQGRANGDEINGQRPGERREPRNSRNMPEKGIDWFILSTFDRMHSNSSEELRSGREML